MTNTEQKPLARQHYFLFALLFFGIEVIIALFFRDSFIRPILGDYLVIILIYCAFQALFHWPPHKAALSALLFSYTIELLQWVDILSMLNIAHNTWTRIILGSTFDWLDMLAYTFGYFTIIGLEPYLRKHLGK